jgi:predicted AAA+ superfamily ATPase
MEIRQNKKPLVFLGARQVGKTYLMDVLPRFARRRCFAVN